MKILPFWSRNATKKLIDKGMSKKELAKAIHVNYTQLCCVMSGSVINESIKASICAYLNIGNE